MSKPIYNENMMPLDLDLPIDGAFAQKCAQHWWSTKDGPPAYRPGYKPHPNPFTLEACEVTVHSRYGTMRAMQRHPQVAANIDCPCGQRFIVPIHRIKFGGLYAPTGHRAYILFGIAVTWCSCGRLLWATLGDTSWCRSMEDLFPTLEIEENDDDVER